MRKYVVGFLLFVLVTKSLLPIFNPYFATGDQKQQIFWMYRFQDPQLFRDDLLADFISSGKFNPPGYTLLYRIGSAFVDPLLLSKIISIVLVIVSVFFVFRLAGALGGEIAGCASALLFTLDVFVIGWENYFQQGLPRGFAYPLLISFLYYFVTKRTVIASVVLVLQTLFYPQIFLISCFILGVSFVRRSFIECIRTYRFIFLGIAVAGVFLLYSYTKEADPFGPIITRSEAKVMEEFYPGGRSSFFRNHLYEYLFMGRAGLNLDKVALYVLLLIPIGYLLGRRLFKVNRIVYDILVSSLILFTVAHTVLFKIHLPSRYVIYTFPLAFNLLVSLNMEGFFNELAKRYSLRFRMPSDKGVFGFLTVLALAVLVYEVRDFGPPKDKIELYRFISSLPKDVLIAGYPKDMDDIPLLSKRKVLVNMELSLPYYKNYYSEVRRRIFDFFTAYYSDNPKEVLSFCRRYGIDYIVINKNHFRRDFLDGKVYYRPFGDYVRSIVKGRKEFVLEKIPDSKKVFKNDTFSVIRCDYDTFK